MRPGNYDYGAADNLESALRTAANTLESFVAQRGQTAHNDFGYTVNGTVEGWVGNAYDKWCVDYNTSQNALTNYVNDLNQLWVQVHNATYDAEMYMYNNSGISRLPVPAPAGNPILAPQNADPDNAEGATPDMLYDYSDLMTGLNDQILPVFKGLRQYVDDYYATYNTSSSSDMPNLIQPIDGLYPDSAVPRAVAYYLTSTVRPMDAYVRTVGQAFENADSNPIASPITTSPHGVTPGDQGDPDGGHFITLSQSRLDKSIRQVEATDASIAKFTADSKAGRQAALSFMASDGVTQQLIDEIAANQDNAAWTSAFLDTLSPDAILLLIQYMNATPGAREKYMPALAQAWVTALDSGQLTPSAVQNLITVMMNDSHRGIYVGFFNQYLLADLKNDPKAAAEFINYATGQQLQQLLDGNFDLPNANSSDKEAQIIGLMELTLRYEPDAVSATEFYNRMWALLKATQPRPAQPALGAAMQFLMTYVAFAVTPPSGDLRQWAQTTGLTVWGLVQQWQNWIGTFEDANHAQTSNEQMWGELIAGMTLSVVLLAVGFAAPEALAGGVAVGSTVLSDVASWGADQIAQLVDSGSGDGNPASDNEKLERLAKYYAELSMVMELIAAGDVIGPDGKPVDLSSSQPIIDVLNSVIYGKGEENYHIKGQPGTTVADIVDHAGEQIPPPES
ncbi:MAG TPA: hypothetical protein VKV38_03640 [Trebonia sp.]|nr:hypothetical protein [Trebonia sp.]